MNQSLGASFYRADSDFKNTCFSIKYSQLKFTQKRWGVDLINTLYSRCIFSVKTKRVLANLGLFELELNCCKSTPEGSFSVSNEADPSAPWCMPSSGQNVGIWPCNNLCF